MSSTTITMMSVLLAGMIGFASHRASLCTVRAVAEVMHTRSAYMFLSFAKAVLWASAISSVLVIWFNFPVPMILMRSSLTFALLGGFVFGVGAAINGGCSLSTLQRFADGDLSMLVTIVGFGMGAAGWLALDATWQFSEHAQVIATAATVPKPDDSWTLLFIWAWALFELFALVIPAVATKRAFTNLLAPTYRLSTAAALLGIAGGILYATQGSWTYTSFYYSSVAAFTGGVSPSSWHALLVGALLMGMIVSSTQRKSFELRSWHQGRLWIRRFAGGCLMGVGGALMPGGNDTLLLSAMPALSSQALLVYCGLMVGIAVTLVAMKQMKLPMSAVLCANDECRETPIASPGLKRLANG